MGLKKRVERPLDYCQWKHFPIPMQGRFFVAYKLGARILFPTLPYWIFIMDHIHLLNSSGQINHYPVDCTVFFANTYPLRFAISPLDSVVHPEQLGPAG